MGSKDQITAENSEKQLEKQFLEIILLLVLLSDVKQISFSLGETWERR